MRVRVCVLPFSRPLHTKYSALPLCLSPYPVPHSDLHSNNTTYPNLCYVCISTLGWFFVFSLWHWVVLQYTEKPSYLIVHSLLQERLAASEFQTNVYDVDVLMLLIILNLKKPVCRVVNCCIAKDKQLRCGKIMSIIFVKIVKIFHEICRELYKHALYR